MTFNQFLIELEKVLQGKTSNNNFNEFVGFAKYKDHIFKVKEIIENELSVKDNLTAPQQKLYKLLQPLEEEQLNSFSSSMLTSYYTPKWISETLQNNLLSYFKNHSTKINVFEPAAGSGNLLNIISKNENISSIKAVEKDYLSSLFLKNNFNENPKVKVLNSPFEKISTEEKYDLIIGNVPFGSYNVHDKNIDQEYYNLYNNRIHNYFFVKSNELIKPGGVIALITTSSMSNLKANDPLKEHLFKENKLIGAYRFPNDTFKEASTKVITDLIILQKTLTPKKELSQEEENYLQLYQDENLNDFSYPLYFKDGNNLLGDFIVSKGYLGNETLTVLNHKEPEDIKIEFEKLLKKDFKKLLDNKLIHQKQTPSNKNKKSNDYYLPVEIIKKYENLVPGNLISYKNSIVRINSSTAEGLTYKKINVPLKHQDRVLKLIELRNTYKLMRKHLRENNIEQAKICQKDLDAKYDVFHWQYGELNLSRNANFIQKDDESDLIFSLEVEKDSIIVKSAIFSQEIKSSQDKSKKVNSIKDAIILSLSEKGKIDEDFITKSLERKKEDWISEALNKQKLFLNPIIKDYNEISSWKLATKNDFLSGYLDGKYNIYKNEHFENTGSYKNYLHKGLIESNTDLLRKNLPVKLTLNEIDPNLGENWIDKKIFERFGKEHFEDPEFKISYYSSIDQFKVSGKSSSKANALYLVNKDRGVETPHNIFKYALEQNTPMITKTVIIGGVEKRVPDKKTKTAIEESVNKLQATFSNWIRKQKDLVPLLENKYHLMFNANVKRDFDSSLVDFENSAFTPYKHQKDAAWQSVLQNGCIIDHEVGFGKSLTMAMATMTKKKLGLINTELVAGLNANYAKLYEDFKTAYPKGNFLLVTPDDVKKGKKQKIFYKIANNNYDAVITAHSALKKFPKSLTVEQIVLQEKLDEINQLFQDNKKDEFLTKKQYRDLERKLENAKVDFERTQFLLDRNKEQGTLTFEDLGIDSITIDESQQFKNLEFNTKHNRVAGLGSTGKVEKTDNLLNYIRAVQHKHGADKGITFASGTTISNSITELYTLFKYLRPNFMEDKGIKTFDQWARNFARKTTEYEETVAGDIKAKERFRYFVKVPELSKIYNDIAHVADFSTFKIERPKAIHNLITLEPFEEQKKYFEDIKYFAKTKDAKFLVGAENTENTKKAYGLICTNLGKKASLDMRLVNPHIFSDNENNKVNQAAKNAYYFYQKYNKDKGTQLIFCDQGTPTSKNFNLYKAIKLSLIKKGIPAAEIGFIHSYDKNKAKAMDMMNKGELRIIIGSTGKLGIGNNCQERLVAMHHLDFPFRPTDLKQRNGRGERKGNKLLPKYDNKIHAFYYAVKGSLDSYLFNLLHIKDSFINQLKNASIHSRTLDEGAIDNDGNLNLDAYMAAVSGNNLLTQRLKVERELNTYLDKKSAFDQKQRLNKYHIDNLSERISKNTKIEDKLKTIQEKAAPIYIDYKKGIIHCDGKTFHDHKKAGNYIQNHFKECFNGNLENKKLPIINNFRLEIFINNKEEQFGVDNYKLLLVTPENIKIGSKSNRLVKDPIKNANYYIEALNRIPSLLQEYQKKISEDKKEIELYKETTGKFPHQTKLLELEKELADIDKKIRNSKKDNEEEQEEQNPKKNEKNKNDLLDNNKGLTL